ncbi:hypothetical protein FHK02_897 [Spirosoma sp. LMG 31448]|uniref:Uncharacterized protein n=1 Tax=Spirosoma utsteinense TaxID=2585773 RepID=A0ABR6VZW9_9BACT|nr:hypothetical protein [Spirosoma utsteinense]MBC3789783.1 hypothetical protein [Spirosoma utsteinense]
MKYRHVGQDEPVSDAACVGIIRGMLDTYRRLCNTDEEINVQSAGNSTNNLSAGSK